MIAVDTNLLVHAHREDSQWHPAASDLMRELAEGPAPWGIPWPCLHEFLAIVTHPRIYAPPTPVSSALAQVAAWLESPTLAVLSEGTGYWDTFASVLRAAKATGPLVHDARVAALCQHHRVKELWTADRDFSRFAGIKTRNPLVR